MSDQNNTSFAHAFLPGLILGLIIGAVAGAFVPDMMSSNKIKINPNHTGSSIVDHDRDGRPDEPTAQELLDQAEAEAAELDDDAQNAAEDLLDDAENAIDETIEDAKNALPKKP